MRIPNGGPLLQRGRILGVSWFSVNRGRMAMPVRRRDALLLGVLGLAGARRAQAAAQPDVTISNGLTVLGKPKLPNGFPYFPYVNPNAPKGGSVTVAAVGNFDSFNPYILRGTAAQGLTGPWIILPG